MSSIIYKNGDNTQSALKELVAAERVDIESLDTSYFPGSTCIVTEDSSVWMLGPDEQWHEL